MSPPPTSPPPTSPPPASPPAGHGAPPAAPPSAAPPPVVARDALDEADFQRLVAGSRALQALARDGARLLPDFPALLEDLYAALVKLTVDVAPEAALPPSARVRRRLVAEVVRSGAYARLHATTRLRPERAGLGALRLGRAALAELRAGRLMLPRELRDAWEATHREEAVAELEREARGARALAQARGDEDPVGRLAAVEAQALDEQARAEGEALAKLGETLDEAARGVPGESLQRLESALDDLAQRAAGEDAARQALGGVPEEAVGGAGGGASVDVLDLGDRLRRSELVRRLSRLVGALRAEARAQRRHRVPRARAEVYGVRRGAGLEALSHLLPVELSALNHPTLRRDFQRRLLEGTLLGYALRGDDERGRGPAVVCLDVSGSMTGNKAVWAKAVTLTLADLARRDGRAVSVLTFSSGPGGLRRYELVPEGRRGPGAGTLGAATRHRRFAQEALLGFVEERVGGGTDFGPPLGLAQEIIRGAKRFREADVVLVTDGEASLRPAEVEAFARFKRETDTRAVGVLVDVADYEQGTVARLCDEVTSVRALTLADARRVFAAFDRPRR